MNEEMLESVEKELKAKFPLGIPRKNIREATGNILHPRTLANRDSLGIGIEGRYKIGRLTIYPVSQTVGFLKKRIASIE